MRNVFAITAHVALRKESVDRNAGLQDIVLDALPVALRKESVDRNLELAKKCYQDAESLSARRAWIEISVKPPAPYWYTRRSPQGERG